MFWELVKESLATLRGSVMRTILTMTGVILGVGAVITIMNLGQSAYGTIEKMIEDSGMGAIQVGRNYAGGQGQDMPLDESVMNILRSADIDGVSDIQPIMASSGDLLSLEDDEAMSLTIQYATVKDFSDIKFVAGRVFEEADIEDKTPVAVIDENIARKVFGGNEAAVGQDLTTDYYGRFRVVGVMSMPSFGRDENSGTMVVPQSLGEASPFFQTNGYVQLAVSVETGQDYERITEEVEQALLDAYGFEEADDLPFRVENVNMIMSQISTMMVVMSLGLSLIAAISLFVGGVGIMNIMLVSVTERTKEIGLMKALGAQDKDIIGQFLVEAVVMTVLGGLLGIGLGIGFSYGVIKIVNVFGEGMSLPEFVFVVDMRAVVISVAVSVAIGLIFGVFPARRAAKLDPVEALRRD